MVIVIAPHWSGVEWSGDGTRHPTFEDGGCRLHFARSRYLNLQESWRAYLSLDVNTLEEYPAVDLVN